MNINIQTLINRPEIEFEQETTVSLKNLHLGSEKTDYVVQVCGKVTRDGNLYRVTGTVDLTIRMLCDRCMHEFDHPIHADLYSEFSSDEQYAGENEDVKPVIKSSIDLSDDILEAIVMEVPMKSLCNEDCKGICKNCGANLNLTACECNSADVDLRLEQLKDIFCVNNKK
ncbi:MAG: YceD family protein [Cellulosilyticaceae bacterium]